MDQMMFKNSEGQYQQDGYCRIKDCVCWKHQRDEVGGCENCNFIKKYRTVTKYIVKVDRQIMVHHKNDWMS
jgi:hypothetical protein